MLRPQTGAVDQGEQVGRGESAARAAGAAGRGIAALVQGERLDGVAGHRPGEHGAGPVGGRQARLTAGPDGAGDLAEGDGRVVDDLEHPVAERQVEPGCIGGRGQHLVQQVAVALDAVDRSPTPAVSARRRRVASASALGSTTVTSWPRRARGTANIPLPPPTSSTRSGVPVPTTGSSAAQTAALRTGNCSAGGERGASAPGEA